MVLNQIGKNTGPRIVTKRGQKIFIYDEEEYLAFILDSGIMHKAGKNQSFGGAWPEKVESGELSAEGIGMNIGLYKAVMKTRNNYTFFVYDKSTDRFYRLENYEMLAQNARPEDYFTPRLVLTPFDAYEMVRDESGLDPYLKKVRSR